MSEFYKLDYQLRKETGSMAVKALRNQGLVPGVLYFHGHDNVNLAIDKKTLWRALHSGNHIFEIKVKDAHQYVMIKELQYHPVTDEIIHVDLMRIRRNVKSAFTLHIVLKGESKGIKQGGVLTQNLTTIEISCLPTRVPEHIVVDVTDVGIDDTLLVSDIVVGEDIEILTDRDQLILAVHHPRVEEEAAPAEEEFAEEAETEDEQESED